MGGYNAIYFVEDEKDIKEKTFEEILDNGYAVHDYAKHGGPFYFLNVPSRYRKMMALLAHHHGGDTGRGILPNDFDPEEFDPEEFASTETPDYRRGFKVVTAKIKRQMQKIQLKTSGFNNDEFVKRFVDGQFSAYNTGDKDYDDFFTNPVAEDVFGHDSETELSGDYNFVFSDKTGELLWSGDDKFDGPCTYGENFAEGKAREKLADANVTAFVLAFKQCFPSVEFDDLKLETEQKIKA